MLNILYSQFAVGLCRFGSLFAAGSWQRRQMRTFLNARLKMAMLRFARYFQDGFWHSTRVDNNRQFPGEMDRPGL
jgi:hypothetical protein